ncbi:MAG: glycerate kinase [Actinomycetota bacterium]|nr:glycerate kinase [Actinomycetota bacterium]
MPLVVIAPDKFKGSLTAPEVAQAVAKGIAAVAPDAELRLVPVADGGDGTLDAALGGPFEAAPVTASGPTGEPVETRYARHGDTAVVEMADVSGLSRLPGGTLDPMSATSRGTGEVVAAALDAGCRKVVLGIGGSASTDGGAGLLVALGARLLDAAGRPVAEGGGALTDVVSLDLTTLHPGLADAEVVVACDVDSPLTGPDGAAAVFGPQKGASHDQVRDLDHALSHWADLVAAATGADVRDAPGAGAAGGVGFAAMAMLGARLEQGVALVLDLLDFEALVAGADLVVVGEGSLDVQSLRGKAPVGVAAVARAHGAEVVAVCGRRLIDDATLQAAGISAAYACADLEPDPARSMSEAARLLERIGSDLAGAHLPG